MARNPFFNPSAAAVTDAVLNHLRLIVTTFLQANSSRAVIPDAEIAALHPVLANAGVFQRLRDELGL